MDHQNPGETVIRIAAVVISIVGSYGAALAVSLIFQAIAFRLGHLGILAPTVVAASAVFAMVASSHSVNSVERGGDERVQ